MSRADDGQGAYFLDIDSFHHVYNFICRFVKRNEKDVQTVLFTVNADNQEIDVTEMELILETLRKQFIRPYAGRMYRRDIPVNRLW